MGPPYRWVNRKYNFDNLGQVSDFVQGYNLFIYDYDGEGSLIVWDPDAPSDKAAFTYLDADDH